METTKTKYANALFSIALEKNKVIEYQDQAKKLLDIFKVNPEFLKFLDCSFLPIDVRLNALNDIFKNCFDEDIFNFLKIVVKKNHALILADMLIDFSSLCNQNQNIGEGIVYSTIPLNENQIKKICDALQQVEKKKIVLKNKIDSSLIGGIKIAINDRVYDGSLSFKLDAMKQNLLKGGE